MSTVAVEAVLASIGVEAPASSVVIDAPAATVTIEDSAASVDVDQPAQPVAVDAAATTTTVEAPTAAVEISVETGPPGPAGADAPAYIHVQNTPATAWVITHSLGRIPSAVSVLDSAGTVWWGEVQHITTSQCVVRFGFAFAGTAYLR